MTESPSDCNASRKLRLSAMKDHGFYILMLTWERIIFRSVEGRTEILNTNEKSPAEAGLSEHARRDSNSRPSGPKPDALSS